MISPVKGLPLTRYLTSTNKSISALLVQEVDEVEHHVYCLSRSLRRDEMNHSSIERHCLMLIFAIQKLFYYLLAHSLNLITKSNHLK